MHSLVDGRIAAHLPCFMCAVHHPVDPVLLAVASEDPREDEVGRVVVPAECTGIGRMIVDEDRPHVRCRSGDLAARYEVIRRFVQGERGREYLAVELLNEWDHLSHALIWYDVTGVDNEDMRHVFLQRTWGGVEVSGRPARELRR